MSKDKRINIRLTEQEKNLIEKKANKCNMTITNYIINSCLKNKIIVINGLDKVDTELRRIGNNINQLTKLANERIIKTICRPICFPLIFLTIILLFLMNLH